MTTISREKFEAAKILGDGWCSTCLCFTLLDIGPEAHDRECPVCDQDTVDGVVHAVAKGYLAVDPDLFPQPVAQA